MQEFFKEKVDKIYSDIDRTPTNEETEPIDPSSIFDGDQWNDFCPISDCDLKVGTPKSGAPIYLPHFGQY